MEQEQMPHKLQLSERQKLTMTGVTEVVSFDENAVVLQTSLGTLLIQGQGLQLKTPSSDGRGKGAPIRRSMAWGGSLPVRQ